MNLFCFSLEGSMDSLYEAVQDSSDAPVYTIPSRASSHACSRSCSPAVVLDDNAKWRESARSISMEITQLQRTNSKKKKKRNVSRSVSDNDVLDHTSCERPASLWLPVNLPGDVDHMKNFQNEDVPRTNLKPAVQTKGGKGGHQTNTKKKAKPVLQSPPQNGTYEGWPPCSDHPNSRQRDLGNGDVAESRGTSKRSQKSGKKASGKSEKESSKKKHISTVHHPPLPTPVEGPYLDVLQAQARRPIPGRAGTFRAQENTTPGALDLRVGPGGSASSTPSHQRWRNTAESAPAWDSSSYHTCRRPLTEYCAYAHDFTLPRDQDLDKARGQPLNGSLKRDPSPRAVPQRCVADTDLSDCNRSTSFGRFEGLRQQPSPAKLEGDGATMGAEESVCESSGKSAGLSKKMRAVMSLTMRRNKGKKHVKSFSEETEDEADRDPEGGAEHVGKGSGKTSNSLESLCSRQSSSSGVASASDGSSNRDSLRLEEDGSYHGQFCGKARVHTDFVPSPYDTDSLKLKVGDIISIISKPPMGIWTGMLNNKVGNFKFIYVDVVIEKEKEEEVPKIRPQKLCKRPRPKTLLELLERLHLEEYASALLLNGYQTVEDLLHLREKHLIELNVTDPEHRQRLLTAAEYRYAEGEEVRDSEDTKVSLAQRLEENSDCPRDSGCFIPSECSDNSKDDLDHPAEAHAVDT